MRKSSKGTAVAKRLRESPKIVEYGNDLAYMEKGNTRRTRRWWAMLEKHVPNKGKRRWRKTHWGKKPTWYPA